MKYFSYDQFSLNELLKLKAESNVTIGLAVPVLNEEKTIRRIIQNVNRCGKLIDQFIVIDSGSTDNSKKICESLGVTVIDDKKASLDLKTKLSKGKGWNLWSSLYYLNTDMVFWLDADIENMSDKFILGIVGPMLKDKSVKFVKGYYQRPKNDSRVTEILARPILNAWFPKTKDIIQPLSGEYGGRRDFLESISFYSGYSVEVAVLIQAVNRLRSGNIVQSYLGSRKHELQSVLNLGKMGASIFQTLLDIADKEKSIKIQKAVSNELIQFLSEDGIKFNPQKYTVKDKELLPIISNSNYARAQI